jgi:hypothetical protein
VIGIHLGRVKTGVIYFALKGYQNFQSGIEDLWRIPRINNMSGGEQPNISILKRKGKKNYVSCSAKYAKVS